MSAEAAPVAAARVETVRPILLAASHGTHNAGGRRAVAGLIRAVAEAAPDLSVQECFVDIQEPDVPAVLAEAGTNPVRIVPLLLSAGYSAHGDLSAAAAVSGQATIAGPLGPDMRLVDLLVRRIRALDVTGADTLILAAAGSGDERAVADCRLMSRMVGAELGYRVEPAFVAGAEPLVADAVAAARGRTAGRVVVVSYLLAPGYFAGLLERCRADVVLPPLLSPHQEPPPELVDLVLERYRA